MRPNPMLRTAIAGGVTLALGLVSGCANDITSAPDAATTGTQAAVVNAPPPSAPTVASQVNLVANDAVYQAARIDPDLLNAWGIAITPTGRFWLSSNGAELSVVYDHDGAQVRPPVTIDGAVTGQVFNSTTGFVIPGSNTPARFIFATEDGTIAAWNAGNAAVTVADRSGSGAIYKGLAMGNTGSRRFLYATDFANGKVDVFDDSFGFVTDQLFQDPGIPTGYGPFGIRNIDGFVVVTYAKRNGIDDEAGPGNGYVDVFNPAGHLVHRVASRGTLNSPWGLESRNGVLYVGNFGDGKISLFSMVGMSLNGQFLGLLSDSAGNPVVIDGLWGLSFDELAADQDRLFFTAGPDDEADGLFGYLRLN